MCQRRRYLVHKPNRDLQFNQTVWSQFEKKMVLFEILAEEFGLKFGPEKRCSQLTSTNEWKVMWSNRVTRVGHMQGIHVIFLPTTLHHTHMPRTPLHQELLADASAKPLMLQRRSLFWRLWRLWGNRPFSRASGDTDLPPEPDLRAGLQ